jgi:hypothetical protein
MPPYLALSYVWGKSTDREPIACNGHILQITVSLAQALRRLRPSRVSSDTGTRSAGLQSLNGEAVEKEEEEEDQVISEELCDQSVREGASKMVWADAICINQEDVIERNHQVQLMKEIYLQMLAT